MSSTPQHGPELLLAIDQGTSATKALLVDAHGMVVASASAPVTASHPLPGWVEQSPAEIWRSVREAVRTCVALSPSRRIAGVGLSTQRESVMMWERATGAPVGPLLGWQDRRTADLCGRLTGQGAGAQVRAVTGLPLDPMFSALKARWLLDTYDPGRLRSKRGELCLGTVDSWLVWQLSGGAGHTVEVGNAARTQLLDIRRRQWDTELLALFGVPAQVLPAVTPSVGPFPPLRDFAPVPDGTPVTAVLGDSHAALFGHGVFVPGRVKATYGTGSSIMGLVADPESAAKDTRLCLTVAWDDGSPAYAVEGNIRSSGDTLRWLSRVVGRTEGELAALAAPDAGGTHLVPAFGGLAAPWWDNDAQGLISGLSFGTGLPELACAALESVAFQVEDVIAAVDDVTGPVSVILADGGPTDNTSLMQLQADTSERVVERPHARDLSALGAAHMAGRAVGLFTGDQLAGMHRDSDVYRPRRSQADNRVRIAAWHEAVLRARARPEGGKGVS
ncbi:FGGY-family carbohydrate kinase [Actinacidiphila bryophytorum]|uniref:ATP:glycerol 3-phosphotransferase n=1 Tax=Actinacidiphila bryophytorum TaxID=1436133 RepID=A0A9W4E1B6_9ACTN|nr:FGGY family carbohydrate kinase [Actinacidiphila bryophytorum]MBM9438385.1 glycerol kinase [Actinacidiphila bryophytorum]MBN6543488.1 glycerol kinase [Actinacidiphila bryophytorum]CAG7614280.1 Apulose kinase [Actinacidiphila bryophytorum]